MTYEYQEITLDYQINKNQVENLYTENLFIGLHSINVKCNAEVHNTLNT